MTQALTVEKKYSLEEYFRFGESAEEKYEFYQGKLLKVPGGTFEHNLIATRISTQLENALGELETPYFVLNSDMKIRVPEYDAVVYPDALVICERVEFFEDRKDVILNPLLVVEVASPSTEEYDRSLKFIYYKSLPSFQEYILVRQDKPLIISSYRKAPNLWEDTMADGLNTSLPLRAVPATLELGRIYKNLFSGEGS